jgi:hypothetical protein
LLGASGNLEPLTRSNKAPSGSDSAFS